MDGLSGLGGWESFPFYFHCLLAGVLCTCTFMVKQGEATMIARRTGSASLITGSLTHSHIICYKYLSVNAFFHEGV